MRALSCSLLLAVLPLSAGPFGGYQYPQLTCPTSRRPWPISEATDLRPLPMAKAVLFKDIPYAGFPDNRVLALHTMKDTATYHLTTVDPQVFNLATAPGGPGRAANRGINCRLTYISFIIRA
ncbi:MAG: hypothetical protein ACRYFZ_04595 [Janthinobacterium lividum]